MIGSLHELSGHPSLNIGFLVSFGGAAQGNLGPASSGVCIWWGDFEINSFQARGLLVQKASRLRNATNNVAEAHGLASILKTTLRFNLWPSKQAFRERVTEFDTNYERP